MEWGATVRLARRYPRTTLGVAVANAIPFVGVVAFSWSVGLVLVFYWLETAVVAASAAAAALVAAEPGDTSDGGVLFGSLLRSDRRIHLRDGWPAVRVRNVPVVVSVLVGFGFFWVVHGVFVVAFAVLIDGPGALSVGPWLGLALLGVAANRAVELYTGQVVQEAYRDATAREEVDAVWGRTTVLHLALVFGGFLVVGFASVAPSGGVAVLALLVALKAPYELAVATHERASSDVAAARRDADVPLARS